MSMRYLFMIVAVSLLVGNFSAFAREIIISAEGRAEVSEKAITVEDEKIAEERAKLYSQLYGDGWRDRRKRIAAEILALQTKTDDPSNQEKRIAVHNAKINAIKKYVSQLGAGDDTKTTYDIIATRNLMPIFIEGVNDVVQEYKIIKEQRESGLLVIQIAAKINESEINRIVRKATESASDATQENNLVLVMVAREVATVDESHGVSIKKEKASENKNESVNVDENTGKGEQTLESSSESKKTSYQTKVQERIEYKNYDIKEVQSRILKSFNQEDIEVIKVQDLLDAVDQDQDEDSSKDKADTNDPLLDLCNSYASGNDFAYRMKKLKKTAIGFECEWFAIAALTIGRDSIDPDTGQSLVVVNLNIDVCRLQTKKMGKKTLSLYKTIAADIQSFKGFGQDPAAAKIDGILKAGKSAASGIAIQMRDKLSQ